jgi:PKD repeat protein
LYDEEDEIVFFTWDFGDGETRENISQGKVTHTYRYDIDASNGEFYPSVTVKTKLGHEDSYRLKTPISVKKKQKEVIVRVESHPTQQVKVGELVTFSLETDGVVEQIDWNFGNTKTFGCDDRSCTNPTMRYYEAGEYEIKTEVQYENDTPVVGRVKIKVYE